jgi:MFS family permease
MIPMAESDHKHDGVKLFRYKYFALAFLLMICSGASEQAMAQWASMFCETGLGVTKVVGDILGPCLFAVMMGIGRTAHGLFGGKLNMEKLLFVLSAFTIGCYLVTVFVPVPFVSLLGCGLCGIGVSVMWPGMLALCASKYPTAGASMFAILALGGDIGCSVGPWLTGTVSDAVVNLVNHSSDIFKNLLDRGFTPDQLGLRAGFLSAVIFPLMMLIGVVLLSKSGKKTNEKK